MKISIIVAAATNGAIGYKNRLPWHIPEDLHRFKALTLGHSVIMGSHTFASLPHGALPGRRNIVVSRKATTLPGCEVFASLRAALEACNDEAEVFIIGGASLYRQALPLAHHIYLTLVEALPDKADTFFPPIDEQQWRQTKKEKHTGFSFLEYELR